MTYEGLLEFAYYKGVEAKEEKLPGKLKGLYFNNCISIKKDLETTTDKACVLAEELGHHYTTTGDILDQSNISNVKQELQARFWAYNKQIGLLGIIKAYENRCRDKTEMAEFLNVTEDFLIEALKCYKHKYGISTKLDNYIIYFEPNLYVVKLL